MILDDIKSGISLIKVAVATLFDQVRQLRADLNTVNTNYTPNDVLTKIKTVDGTGSGLDADLLDGQDSLYFTNSANLTGTFDYSQIVYDADPLIINYSDTGFNFTRNLARLASLEYPAMAEMTAWSFTRASVATSTSVAGLLTSLGTNVPNISDKGLLVEEARTNLLLRSREFDNASWTKGGGGTASIPVITANDAIAPDGTLTADKIVVSLNGGTTSSDRSYLEQFLSGLTTSSNYVGTLYVKGVPGEKIVYRQVAASSYLLHTFTGGWDLISRIEAAFSASSSVEFGLRGSFGTSNAITFHAWQADLQLGSFATSPITTTTAAVTRPVDLPVLTYALGGVRTNKVTAFNANPTDVSGWTIDAGVTGSVVNDVGALAAAGLSSLATSGNVYQFTNSNGVAAYARPPGPSGNTNIHVASAYVRGGTGDIRSSGGAGTVTFPASSTYVRRQTVAYTPTSTSSVVAITIDAGQTVFVILPQLEESAVVTAPIVTLGAIGYGDIPQDFTIFGEVEFTKTMAVVQRFIEFSDGTSSNRILVQRSAAGAIEAFVTLRGTSTMVGTIAKTGNRISKIALSRTGSSYTLVVDGTNVATISNPGLPNMTTLAIGNALGGTLVLNDYVRRIGIDLFARTVADMQDRTV